MHIAEFWDYVDQSGGPDACWPWTRGRHPAGYGIAHIAEQQGRAILAHRVALALSVGPPNVNQYLGLHRCDNPPCCNPAHLYWGDAYDNAQDRVGNRVRVIEDPLPFDLPGSLVEF